MSSPCSNVYTPVITKRHDSPLPLLHISRVQSSFRKMRLTRRLQTARLRVAAAGAALQKRLELVYTQLQMLQQTAAVIKA
jgi:hypothetical protein